MGFTLAEAQWLVKFMRGLPGQAAPSPGDEQEMYMRAQEGGALWPGPIEQMRHELEMQAAYSDYPAEEPPFGDFQGSYYDEYW